MRFFQVTGYEHDDNRSSLALESSTTVPLNQRCRIKSPLHSKGETPTVVFEFIPVIKVMEKAEDPAGSRGILNQTSSRNPAQRACR